MSGPKRAAPPQHRSLDIQSINAIARWAVTACGLSLLAFVPALLGSRSVADSTGALATYCAWASLLKAALASSRRRVPGAAGLNEWDECAGLMAVYLLAHVGNRLLR